MAKIASFPTGSFVKADMIGTPWQHQGGHVVKMAGTDVASMAQWETNNAEFCRGGDLNSTASFSADTGKGLFSSALYGGGVAHYPNGVDGLRFTHVQNSTASRALWLHRVGLIIASNTPAGAYKFVDLGGILYKDGYEHTKTYVFNRDLLQALKPKSHGGDGWFVEKLAFCVCTVGGTVQRSSWLEIRDVQWRFVAAKRGRDLIEENRIG